MSKVNDSLGDFLAVWVKRLNGRLIWIGLLRIVSIVGPLFALSVALLKLLTGLQWSLGSLMFAWLLASILISAGISAWLARRFWFDQTAAAAWIDRACSSNELLSAALACRMHPQIARFDADISLAADHLLAELQLRAVDGTGPRLSPRPWKKAWLRAVVGVVVSLSLVSMPLWLPASAVNGMASGKQSAAVKAALADSAATGAKLNPGQQLIPHNPRLAALANQAIEANDTEALAYLMDQADAGMADLLRSALGDADKSALSSEREKLRQAARQARQNLEDRQRSGQLGPKDQGANPSGQKDGTGLEKKRSDPNGEQTANQGRESASGQQSTEHEGSSATSATTMQAGSGSKNSGENGNHATNPNDPAGSKAGEGRAERTANIKAAAAVTRPSLILKNQENGSFEIVLPGKDARAPLSQLVPAAGRSAEAAVDRTNAPLEFRETVQSYFQALSREVER